MTLGRARILKAGGADPASSTSTAWRGHAPARPADAADDTTSVRANDEALMAALARRIPRAVLDARTEAALIVAEAESAAAEIVRDARASVAELAETTAREAREAEIARVAAELLVERASELAKMERELEATIALASALAERIVGEALAIEPSRVALLAAHALEEARGARRIRIEASPEDAAALATELASLGDGVASVETNEELSRGSLVVHTELGRIDARIAPQLARLSAALREAMLEDRRGGRGDKGSTPA